MAKLWFSRPSNWSELEAPTDPEALAVPALSTDPADEGKVLDAYTGEPVAPGESGVRVIGPYPIDHTDITADGATLDLFTPAIGDVILSWWSDPDTFEVGDSDILMGQGTAWAAGAATRSADWSAHSGANLAAFGAWGQPWHGGDTIALDAEANAITTSYLTRYGEDGVRHRSTLAVVTAALPVQVANVSGGAAATGHVDLYFLVATPTLP